VVAGKVKRAYVETEDGQIHYRWLGERGQPMLFLHQVPSSSRMFEPLMRLFVARGYRAVAMDLPGFGESDPPKRAYSIGGLREAADRFVEALGLGPLAAVVGCHTGSLVAVDLAISRPEGVRSLILLGVPYYATAEAREARFQGKEVQPIVPQADGGHLLREWHRWRGYFPESDLGLAQQEYVDLVKSADYAAAYRAAFDYDNAARMPLVRCPTLVVAGTCDLPNQDEAVRALANGQIVWIQDGGTLLAQERADEVASASLAFLDRLAR
jgi:pimeloyl-ACP methyl ester carboxylesterase